MRSSHPSGKPSSPRTMKPRWLLRYLHAEGIDRTVMARIAGVEPDRLLDDQDRMSLDTYLMLFKWAADHFKRPLLGLELAADYHIEDFDLLIFLGANADSLAESFRLFTRYEKILEQGTSLQSIEHPGAVEIRYAISTDSPEHAVQDVEFTMATILPAAKSFADVDLTPIKVSFRHPQTQPLEAYQTLFSCPVLFGQPHNSLWIDYADWSKRSPSANHALLGILTAQADHLLQALEVSGDFLEQVRFLIGSNLGTRAFNGAALAEHLHLTPRTLHRRLTALGTSFNKLRREQIMIASCKALETSDVSIAAIAQQLGYADSSGFVRAFKQHQGISPLQYRHQLRAL